jgi:hypothetical protein
VSYVKTFISTIFSAAVACACSSTTRHPATDSCERLFEAYGIATQGCTGQQFSASMRDNFVQNCVNTAAAPGSNASTAFLNGCAQALLLPSRCDELSELVACQTPAGSFPDGEACGDGAQCASGDCATGTTRSPSSIYCGICRATAGVGGDCLGGTRCGVGLRCISGKCAVRETAADGAACTTSAGGTVGCAAGSFCQVSADASARRCTRYPQKGEACTSTCPAALTCLGGRCVDRIEAGGDCPEDRGCKAGLSCEGRKCVASAVAGATAQVDQACGAINVPGAPTRYAYCAAGLTCVYQPPGTPSGTCRANVAKGGACSADTTPCDTYLVCVEGTCQVKDASSCR